MFDFSSLGDLLGGASDIVPEIPNVSEIIPTDAIANVTDQVSEVGNNIGDSIGSLLP